MGDLGSCAEMRFLRNGERLKGYPLFADDLYTVLKPDVTDEDIERMEIPVYRELAKELKNGSYQTAYRVATFDCYISRIYHCRAHRYTLSVATY